MLTAGAPILGPGGEFYGIAGLDIALEAIERIVGKADLQLSQLDGVVDDFAYLGSAQGRIIVHPDRSLMIGQNNPGGSVLDLPAGAEIMAAQSGS
jgi:hypothetical protein